MIPKRLEALSFADVGSLVASGTREGRSLEFKRDQVGGKDEDRREFLADVSAMANSYGGDIVIGVDAPAGVASAAPGIELPDADAEMLRLHQILQGGLEPRLAHVEMRWLPKAEDQGALVIRTRASLSAPHRVTFRDHAKFYGRHSAGKFTMDTFQLRAAFAASDSVPERIRSFHAEQVERAGSDDHVLPLTAGPIAFLHLIPLSAFTAPMELRFGLHDYVAPPRTGGVSWMPTFEGVVAYSGPEDTPLRGVRTFSLLHRNGILEMAANVSSSSRPEGVHPGTLEAALNDYTEAACRAAKQFGIEGPFGYAFSLTRMDGATLQLGHEMSARPMPCRRRTLTFPMLLLEEPLMGDAHLTRIKELMWNTFGVERPGGFRPR